MESMYFGDEDPMLVTPRQHRKMHFDPADTESKPQDLVLLFDDCSNSFSFSEGGGRAADICSPNIISPMNAVPHQKVCTCVYKHTISVW